MFILTTDFQDLTDANHERKRANQIHQINPFLFSFSNTECTKETKAFFAEAQQAKASEKWLWTQEIFTRIFLKDSLKIWLYSLRLIKLCKSLRPPTSSTFRAQADKTIFRKAQQAKASHRTHVSITLLCPLRMGIWAGGEISNAQTFVQKKDNEHVVYVHFC